MSNSARERLEYELRLGPEVKPVVRGQAVALRLPDWEELPNKFVDSAEEIPIRR